MKFIVDKCVPVLINEMVSMIDVINWVTWIIRGGSTLLRQFILVSNGSMDIFDGGAYLWKLKILGSSCKIPRTGVQLHLYSGVICN